MSKNKMSIWAIIILVATIISLVLLVTAVVLTAVGVPVALEAAKQAALDTGVTAEEADVIAGVAVGAIIVALVFSSIFDILKVIGGFKFSLQGKWGIFCIIVSILSVVGGVWSLISDIVNKSSVGTIVTAALSLVVSLVLCFACFKHRAELK